MLRLVGRILGFAFGIAFNLFGWLFMVGLRGLRTFFVLGLRFAFLTLINLFVGIPQGSDIIANEMVGRAIEEGVPQEHEETIYQLAKGLAIGSIIFGWTMLSFFTVAFCTLCSLITIWIL